MAMGRDLAAARSILDEPAPAHSQSPVSQTVWTGPLDGGSGGTAARLSSGNGATRVATAVATEQPTALESLSAIDWVLPGTELLEPRAAGRVGAGVDHESNKRRIEEKLLSFSIPAKVVAVN